MSTFVLIHGACHGAWCWYKVVPRLRQRGHKVVVPDLPSHGRDRTPTASVSLESYVDCVRQVLDSQGEPVVLVGHSLGGLVISQAAEQRPYRIAKLVYLAAFLLEHGQTILEIAETDTESQLLSSFVLNEDQSVATVKQEAQKCLFYDDCSDEDVALAQSLLVPAATAPSETPLRTTSNSWGQIPRFYIECVCDKAISVSVQRIMYQKVKCRRVVSMDTSHSPFFSAAGALVDHLDSL